MMTNPLDSIRDLAALARQEQPPIGDVVPGVMVAISSSAAEPLTRPLSAFTWATAAAAIILAVAWWFWPDMQTTDPINELFQIASVWTP